MTVRLAWDGQYDTKTDFLLWYGRERGLDLWDEAGASFATKGGCIRSQMLIANREEDDPRELHCVAAHKAKVKGKAPARARALARAKKT